MVAGEVVAGEVVGSRGAHGSALPSQACLTLLLLLLLLLPVLLLPLLCSIVAARQREQRAVAGGGVAQVDAVHAAARRGRGAELGIRAAPNATSTASR